MTRFLVLLLVSGCASSLFTPNVTTMKIRQAADGSISIDSGKDVRADTVTFKRGDEEVSVTGYSSMANTDAIRAETNREQVQIDGIIRAMQTGAAVAGQAAKGAVGVP